MADPRLARAREAAAQAFTSMRARLSIMIEQKQIRMGEKNVDPETLQGLNYASKFLTDWQNILCGDISKMDPRVIKPGIDYLGTVIKFLDAQGIGAAGEMSALATIYNLQNAASRAPAVEGKESKTPPPAVEGKEVKTPAPAGSAPVAAERRLASAAPRIIRPAPAAPAPMAADRKLAPAAEEKDLNSEALKVLDSIRQKIGNQQVYIDMVKENIRNRNYSSMDIFGNFLKTLNERNIGTPEERALLEKWHKQASQEEGIKNNFLVAAEKLNSAVLTIRHARFDKLTSKETDRYFELGRLDYMNAGESKEYKRLSAKFGPSLSPAEDKLLQPLNYKIVYDYKNTSNVYDFKNTSYENRVKAIGNLVDYIKLIDQYNIGTKEDRAAVKEFYGLLQKQYPREAYDATRFAIPSQAPAEGKADRKASAASAPAAQATPATAPAPLAAERKFAAMYQPPQRTAEEKFDSDVLMALIGIGSKISREGDRLDPTLASALKEFITKVEERTQKDAKPIDIPYFKKTLAVLEKHRLIREHDKVTLETLRKQLEHQYKQEKQEKPIKDKFLKAVEKLDQAMSKIKEDKSTSFREREILNSLGVDYKDYTTSKKFDFKQSAPYERHDALADLAKYIKVIDRYHLGTKEDRAAVKEFYELLQKQYPEEAKEAKIIVESDERFIARFIARSVSHLAIATPTRAPAYPPLRYDRTPVDLAAERKWDALPKDDETGKKFQDFFQTVIKTQPAVELKACKVVAADGDHLCRLEFNSKGDADRAMGIFEASAKRSPSNPNVLEINIERSLAFKGEAPKVVAQFLELFKAQPQQAQEAAPPGGPSPS